MLARAAGAVKRTEGQIEGNVLPVEPFTQAGEVAEAKDCVVGEVCGPVLPEGALDG